MIKAKRAAQLSREEASQLMSWCDWQIEALWDDLNLQQILNVYHASAEYEDAQSWLEEEPEKAVKGFNKAVGKEILNYPPFIR